MQTLFSRFLHDDRGQDLIEYALLAGLISIGSIVGITLVGTSLLTHFNTVGASVAAAS
jgi:pilus assembly protein Flp/PilA